MPLIEILIGLRSLQKSYSERQENLAASEPTKSMDSKQSFARLTPETTTPNELTTTTKENIDKYDAKPSESEWQQHVNEAPSDIPAAACDTSATHLHSSGLR